MPRGACNSRVCRRRNNFIFKTRYRKNVPTYALPRSATSTFEYASCNAHTEYLLFGSLSIRCRPCIVFANSALVALTSAARSDRTCNIHVIRVWGEEKESCCNCNLVYLTALKRVMHSQSSVHNSRAPAGVCAVQLCKASHNMQCNTLTTITDHSTAAAAFVIRARRSSAPQSVVVSLQCSR